MRYIILYGSRYGNARRYAETLAEKRRIPILSCRQVKNLKDFDTVIYIGSLYAGRVTGLTKVLRISGCEEKRIFLITVGLADGDLGKNADRIRESVRKQVSADVFERMEIFHLRGGIDYGRLSFIHRQMMKFLCRHLSRIPQEKRDEETQKMIDTYGQKIDIFEPEKLDRIWKCIAEAR